MGALVQSIATSVVDHINGVAAFTEPTAPLKLRLMTANGSATSAGTEATGGSYVAQTITMGSAAAGASSNTNAITYTNMPAQTIVGLEIWDSAGTPKRLWWGAVTTSQVYALGNNATVAIGAISATLS